MERLCTECALLHQLCTRKVGPRTKADCPAGAIRLKLPVARESVGLRPLADTRARHGPLPSDMPRGHIGRRAPCRRCRQAPADPRTRFSAAGDGGRPSGLSVRDLAPATGDLCMSPFGVVPGTNLRRDGMAGCPPTSTRRPGRSLMSEPSGRIDRGLKDGAGLAPRKRSVRMASEERALAVRSGAHPGPTQVPPGGWSEGGTPGAVGRSALPASPEAGFAPRRRSKLRLLDARSGLAANVDWERPRRFFVPEPLPAPEASVNAPFRGAGARSP